MGRAPSSAGRCTAKAACHGTEGFTRQVCIWPGGADVPGTFGHQRGHSAWCEGKSHSIQVTNVCSFLRGCWLKWLQSSIDHLGHIRVTEEALSRALFVALAAFSISVISLVPFVVDDASKSSSVIYVGRQGSECYHLTEEPLAKKTSSSRLQLAATRNLQVCPGPHSQAYGWPTCESDDEPQNWILLQGWEVVR